MVQTQKQSENNQLIWDKCAKSYSQFDTRHFSSRLKLQLLKKYTTINSKCLDIGIANGIYSLPFASSISSIYGIDINDIMLTNCKIEMTSKNISNIRLSKADAQNIPFSNDVFDLIFSYATLVIIPNAYKVISEIHRTLKPGGVTILDFPGKNNLAKNYWNSYYRSRGHFGVNGFSLSEIEDLLNKWNLNIIELHSTGFMDQWKYIPIIRRFKFIDELIHRKDQNPDFDYRISKLFSVFANHWFVVAEKMQY